MNERRQIAEEHGDTAKGLAGLGNALSSDKHNKRHLRHLEISNRTVDALGNTTTQARRQWRPKEAKQEVVQTAR